MANSKAPYFKVSRPIQADSLILSSSAEVTIASGAVTLTQGLHTVDTENDDASDNLDTISGLGAGELAVLYPASGARTVVLRHLAGNIVCPGAADISLADATDHVLLLGTATQVIVLAASLLAGAAAVFASLDLNGGADALILDADADTTISAPNDDQIDIEVNGADDFRITANTLTALSGSTIATDTIAETTAGAGVTVDSLLIKDGRPLNDDVVKASIAVANATGGATGAALTVDLTRADGATVLAGARQIAIRASASGAGQYNPADPAPESSLTFGSATKGSIIATAAGWCLAETDSAGEFDCTATNTEDETLYFWVETAKKVSDLSKACLVMGSNSDSAQWSA